VKKVTVYTLPACVQCDSTKRYLDKHGVIYETVDLSQAPVAMEKIRALGYTQAPIVETETNHWSGFRMNELNGLIKQIHLNGVRDAQ
jgi:glutaredoxin-like protein NrdH